MKKLTLALAFFLSANFLMAQESTNLVQTLNPQEAKGVKLDIQTTDGKNNAAVYEKSKDWDEGAGAIRLNIVIEANVPTAIVQQLVKAGRYKIQGNLKGDLFVIEAPNLQKTITIRGTDLVEKIKIKAEAPTYFKMASNKEGIAFLGADMKEVVAMVEAAGIKTTNKTMGMGKLDYMSNLFKIKGETACKITIKGNDENAEDFEDLEFGDITIDGKDVSEFEF